RSRWSWRRRRCPCPRRASACASQMPTHRTSPSARDSRRASRNERRDSSSLLLVGLTHAVSRFCACVVEAPAVHEAVVLGVDGVAGAPAPAGLATPPTAFVH